MAGKVVQFSDLRAAKRSQLRLQHARDNQRQYAAAKVSRTTGDWTPVSKSINELTRTSLPAMRNRIRQMVRDFPYFDRAVNILVNFTVGTGTNFQSRVINPNWKPGGKEKKFDRVACQKIEDAVAWAMDELDAAGHRHGAELERFAKREDVEAGEFLLVKRAIKEPGRYLPYALQAFEAEWLTDCGAKPEGKNIVDQGIEYDRSTGRVVAYHLTDPDSWGSSIRVPREYVLHDFEQRRNGQLRGVSPFASGVLIAHDIEDFLDATIDTNKLAAKYLALVTTDDLETWQENRAMEQDPENPAKKVDAMENAIVEYLRPGEQIHFPTNNTVGGTFEPFVKFELQMLAIATNTTYSLLSGNYGDSNYTTLRGERQDLRTMFAPHHQRNILHFCQPVVRDIIDQAVMAGKLDLPGYWKNPRTYQRCVFIPPGQEPIDPLRESKANRDDVEGRLRSPQEIVAKRGRDIEEVLDEVQEFEEMLEERGLLADAGDVSLASNPAALGAKSNRQLADLVSRAVEDALDRRDLLTDTEG
jgi:lambda family phage portal protein